jgi:CTP synthase (UTP-ammonia lyase)
VLVEYARNVCGIKDAEHAETSPDAAALIVTPLSCSLVGESHRVTLAPESRAARLYESGYAIEDYYCNYGLNAQYRPLLEHAGLRFSGVDADGEVRVVELDTHPFFLATLYCFQTRSRSDRPHPVVAAFVAAARS